jgi:hypothetical protein
MWELQAAGWLGASFFALIMLSAIQPRGERIGWIAWGVSVWVGMVFILAATSIQWGWPL